MNRQEMIEGLRAEIAQLQKVVDLLSDQPKAPDLARAQGRPRKKATASPLTEPAASSAGVRQMSPEGKARIAAAQRKRWAEQKAGSSTVAKSQETDSTPAKRSNAGKAVKKVAAKKSAKSAGRPRKAAKSASGASEKSGSKSLAKKSVSRPVKAKKAAADA